MTFLNHEKKVKIKTVSRHNRPIVLVLEPFYCPFCEIKLREVEYLNEECPYCKRTVLVRRVVTNKEPYFIIERRKGERRYAK